MRTSRRSAALLTGAGASLAAIAATVRGVRSLVDGDFHLADLDLQLDPDEI